VKVKRDQVFSDSHHRKKERREGVKRSYLSLILCKKPLMLPLSGRGKKRLGPVGLSLAARSTAREKEGTRWGGSARPSNCARGCMVLLLLNGKRGKRENSFLASGLNPGGGGRKKKGERHLLPLLSRYRPEDGKEERARCICRCNRESSEKRRRSLCLILKRTHVFYSLTGKILRCILLTGRKREEVVSSKP